jgi:hypothetical protein
MACCTKKNLATLMQAYSNVRVYRKKNYKNKQFQATHTHTQFGYYQGDQTERIFASWVIVFFGTFFNEKNRPKVYIGNFFRSKSYELILTQNGLGNILGDFFTNSSGHPGKYVHMYSEVDGKGKLLNDFFPYGT